MAMPSACGGFQRVDTLRPLEALERGPEPVESFTIITRPAELTHWGYALFGAWARIVAALEPRPGELVVNKTTFGTFNSTGLDHALRSLGIASLVVGGVVTNVCVETTARDAADRGYQVVLLDDGCAALSQEIHEVTLLSIGVYFGRVRRTDEVLALLKGDDVAPSSSSGTGAVHSLRRS